jgi:hypothetical protein
MMPTSSGGRMPSAGRRRRRASGMALAVVAGMALALGVVLALALAARAAATDSNALRLLMLGAQDMNTPQTLLRADVTLEVEIPQGTRKTDAIALFAPGKEARWYLQLREPALRALVLGAERKVMERTGSITQTVPIGATIDALGIAYEDLSRFIVDDFKTWQITDESAATILVGMHPSVESAYVYRAYTFDKEKTVPLKVQFYAKSLNNLVKLRVDSDHALVGKKWFPGAIAIQNFPENSTTRLQVRWSQNASTPPELLAPASFPGTAPLPWEGAAASPSPQP